MPSLKRVLLLEANNQRRWIGGRVSPEMHIPPVALLSLAAFARAAFPETEFRVAETSLDAATDAGLLDLLKDFRPDLVGIRGVNAFLEETRRAAAAVKRWNPVPVVIGGPIASSMKGRLLEAVPDADVLVKGEGEESFAELLGGAAPENVAGVIFRGPKGPAETRDRDPFPDLDKLPLPDYGLVDLARYEPWLSYAYNHRLQGVLLTSRGCPFQCSYCFTFGGKTVRLRSAAHIFAEMETLAARGVRDFYFVDDIFNIDKRRALDLFARLRAAGKEWRLYFVNGLRADIMDREFVDEMVRAGTVWVTYAVETASPRLQEYTRRRMSLEKAREVIRHTQDRGVAVNVNTMYGFPTETPEEARLTLDWLAGLRRPSLLPYHFNLRGYEGCDIVEQAEEAGWDRSAFLADNAASYNDLPSGSPTFSRGEMLEHLLEYHERFGMANAAHLAACVETLRGIGYTDRDLVDMYTLLQNRPLKSVADIPKLPVKAAS